MEEGKSLIMNENVNDSVTVENLIEKYDSLSISEKRKELGREVAEMIIVIQKLISDTIAGVNISNLEDFNNLFDGESSESDYLTGFYEDLLNFKELLGMYLDKVVLPNYED